MELNIKAIHFDTNERLEQFIAKKQINSSDAIPPQPSWK